MIDPRYEDPMYRGPECDGLSPDASFDLAKQMRIAARNRRIGRALDTKRVARASRIWLNAVIAIASLVGGISIMFGLMEFFR